MMQHNSIIKCQFASFLPNTKCVQSHTEGFFPPSAPVGHKSPMQIRYSALQQHWPTWKLNQMHELQKGLLLPNRLEGDNGGLSYGQKCK